ncbi:hypothetical protein [Streptomyces sp. NPDC015131]|uniref:hypothetical protein n=1 Tax=Streptomyces sp. NPDC015131 TaxID=3364941 RepID=UPI0036F89FCD
MRSKVARTTAGAIAMVFAVAVGGTATAAWTAYDGPASGATAQVLAGDEGPSGPKPRQPLAPRTATGA